MSLEIFWRAIGWFGLVWFASAGAMVITMQLFLPRAWAQIRAHPPHGPQWAYTLWYERRRVYGAMMALALLFAALATLLFLLSQ